MAMNERALNAYISEAIEQQAPPGFETEVEEHGSELGGQRVPDIQVRMPYGLRAIIETEYGRPAVDDAKAKLGYQFKDAATLPMKSILAVGMPRRLGEMRRIERNSILASDEPIFELQVVTGSGQSDPEMTVVPSNPIAVSLRDLVQYAWLSAIPEEYSSREMRKVVDVLHGARNALVDRLKLQGTRAQERLLSAYDPGGSGLKAVAGNVVGTLTSMMQLHLCLKEWASSGLEDILPLGHERLWQTGGRQHGVAHNIAAEWRKIEQIDYQPLSTLAAEMIEHPDLSPQLGDTLRVIREALTEYIDTGISATTNVAAEIWQSMIPDRDQRASYYTKPVTAEMLANLTVPRLTRPAEATYNEVCAGTGTLARATEENIRFRHYAGTDDKTSIHAERMERFIRLTDINQQSVSVASANMAALEPDTAYSTNAIFAITAEGGALNYLTRDGLSDMETALIGRDGERTDMLALEKCSANICNNNDPYFMARKGAKNPVPTAKMKYFKSQADRRLRGIANGNAGLASFMHVIEHKLLSYGGVHGKVLPLKAAHADSYGGFRRNIETAYRDVIAVCTAAGDGTSMSADTGVQEMLVVGTKQPIPPLNGHLDDDGDKAVTCVNLTRTFATKLEAKMFADVIRRDTANRMVSGEIKVGNVVGTYYRMTGLGEGKPWSALGSSGAFTELTERISFGVAWNVSTGERQTFDLPMTTLGALVEKGPTHDLIGLTAESEGTDRKGAFLFHPANTLIGGQLRINPSLWNADAAKQVRITCQPTHYGEPRTSSEAATAMQESAGNFHLNRGLRTSAQKIAVAYTENNCMGGRTWNTFKADEDVAKSVALFLNSTLGMIIRIGYGQLSDQGRAPINVKAIDGHPVPDFAADTEAGANARQVATDNFDRLRELELNRIALSAIDPNRHEIDRVVAQMLGFPTEVETDRMLAHWRELMCLQPAINGNNKTVLAALKAHGIG